MTPIYENKQKEREMTSLVSARDSITELFRERPGATVPAAWAALPRVDMDALFTDDPGAGGLAPPADAAARAALSPTQAKLDALFIDGAAPGAGAGAGGETAAPMRRNVSITDLFA